MDARLYRRTTAEWLPLYRLQGAAWCRYTVMNDAGGFSYAALAAMVTVGFCEGVTK
jgi:hypothetical protein